MFRSVQPPNSNIPLRSLKDGGHRLWCVVAGAACDIVRVQFKLGHTPISIQIQPHIKQGLQQVTVRAGHHG